jgi:hypothetical protein
VMYPVNCFCVSKVVTQVPGRGSVYEMVMFGLAGDESIRAGLGVVTN